VNQELTLALARGRVALAELVDVCAEELDALFEQGARLLDAGQNDAACSVLAGVAAMFPYCARYYRGYAIALHRAGRYREAVGAYSAALALQPGSAATLCYRGEAFLALAEVDQARRDLTAVDAATAYGARAAHVLEKLARIDAEVAPVPAPPPLEATVTFVLADGTPITPEAPAALEVTATALIPGRRRARRQPHRHADTAIVRRRQGGPLWEDPTC
jgi:tetratricopeptide (TPR) repeat protein